ncbi:DUF2917 domain-containing protein [Aquincola sp. S2]|uniref:DUF2917 domain-containing protein n=1 Tax=Pseudaquabacterium terrae TaxID=2732868 RepID=A0ABX2ETU1_9BURK|nr:DUF2917 domain-containing protein [Aquabacterium terrae]NRF71954.1 DUF2917 domain-containing protein [Aquabacterium terrae]
MNTMHVISHRSELPATTAMRLGEADLIALDVQPGDRLRSDCGTLWITVDGEARDVLVSAGEVHTIEAAGRINVSALRSANLVVLGQAPLRWRRVSEAGRGFAERLEDAFRALSSRPAWH